MTSRRGLGVGRSKGTAGGVEQLVRLSDCLLPAGEVAVVPWLLFSQPVPDRPVALLTGLVLRRVRQSGWLG